MSSHVILLVGVIMFAAGAVFGPVMRCGTSPHPAPSQGMGEQMQPQLPALARELNLTTAKRVIYNVGCYRDPPSPIDADTIVIAVEANPNTASNVPHVPNRFVLTAAMSDAWGVAMYNDYEGSGSLLKPNFNHESKEAREWTERWTQHGNQGRKVAVPTLPLSAVMQLGQGLDCWFMKIDAQGMDYRIAKSGGQELTRCPYLLAETYCNGFQTYAAAENDFDKHWLPMMTSLGFKPLSNCSAGEINILWQNTKMQVMDLAEVSRLCPVCVT
jgi:hypothetical protein